MYHVLVPGTEIGLGLLVGALGARLKNGAVLVTIEVALIALEGRLLLGLLRKLTLHIVA